MKKLLFVSSVYPSNVGGTRRLLHNLEHFSRKFEVHLLRVDTGASQEGSRLPLPPDVKEVLVRPRGFSPDPLAFLYPRTWKHLLRLGSAGRAVQQYVDKNRIDCVVMFAQDASFSFRAIRAPAKVAELLDSHSLYYSTKRRQAKGAPEALFCLAAWALSGIAERLLSASFDMLVFVSEKDREASAVNKSKAVVCHDLRESPLASRNLRQRSLDAAIIGRWAHPPNRDGLLRILPQLGRIRGRVAIAGPGLPQGMRAAPNVSVKGYVGDLSRLLSDAKICIIPVWYGAGQQNKVFDALRHGCRVVSTSFARAQFEENGFVSESVVYSDNLVAAANLAIASWSPLDAKRAYGAYAKFRAITLGREREYVEKVGRLIQSSP